MIYQSKKNPDVTAKIVKKPNEMTVILEYLTGDETGKNVTITTSTLQRYWRKTDAEEPTEESTEKSAAEILNVDMDEVNKPYAPEVTPHYIPKPESVKEYEAKKKRKQVDVPDFDTIVDDLGSVSVKVNTGYVKLKDKFTTVWRKPGGVFVYTVEELWKALTDAGLTSKPNKDKQRPYGFEITNMDDYNTLKEVIIKSMEG